MTSITVCTTKWVNQMPHPVVPGALRCALPVQGALRHVCLLASAWRAMRLVAYKTAQSPFGAGPHGLLRFLRRLVNRTTTLGVIRVVTAASPNRAIVAMGLRCDCLFARVHGHCHTETVDLHSGLNLFLHLGNDPSQAKRRACFSEIYGAADRSVFDAINSWFRLKLRCKSTIRLLNRMLCTPSKLR